ncbi:MAG: hypothetical protein KA285_01965 [Bacteroidia bacterium]|nr:hypothetical protein [Bacteroidia bacterium]
MEKVVSKLKLFVFIFILLESFKLSAQNSVPYLEKKITIQTINGNAEDVLKSIAQQGGFTFSYGPLVVEGMKSLTIQAKSKPAREVLNQMFEGQVTYKQKGSHVILVRNVKTNNVVIPSYFLITGYVVNAQSGDQIPEVSVFEKKSRVSAITNHYGYFTLKVDKKDVGETLLLNINKANYKDTVYYVKQAGSAHISITIYPLELPDSNSITDTQYADSLMRVDQMAFVNLLLNNEEEVHNRNIKDTIYRKFQVSFVPFIGSNLRLSGNTVNDYSLNVLGGYSMGTRKLEVGGLFNIDRDSVKSVQVAGLFNLAGGHVEGAQFAGLLNYNLKKTSGAEFSGLLNVNHDTINGAQFAGLMNVNLKSASGFQAAGLMNVNLKRVETVQMAGLMNVSLHGTKGAQIAGLMNVSGGEIHGAQISGLLNFATTIHGSQIGFLNFADSVDGVPIGFLSFVRSGYHQLEVSTNETFPLNVALRTGVRSFYNIVEAGMRFDSDIPVWYFGYGIGTAANMGKKWQVDFDLTMSQPLQGNELNYFNPLTKLNVTFEKRFSKYFSLAAGPSLNVLASNLNDPTFNSILTEIPPSHVMNTQVSGEYKYSSWIGAKVALRFF